MVRANMVSESSYEKLVYSILESLGCKFAKQAELPGYLEMCGRRHKYDAVLWKERIVSEVDGCWYHGCQRCFSPLKEWQKKTNSRDKEIDRITRRLGWKIRRIKIHALDLNPTRSVRRAIDVAKTSRARKR
jgi:hypothetical protein